MATFLDRFPDPARDIDPSSVNGEQTAVFAGGCFWCVEAVFEPVEGVIDAVSGYAGGTAETADYETVCSGTTDHAEAVRIRYDPKRITYGQLLKLFFSIAHDPTQLNRQGNDHGRQYRSAIFYADEAQKEVAEAYIRQLDEAHVFDAPIVTRLEPLRGFYEAEDYHQGYAERNPFQPYIAYTAAPKVKKLHQYYGDKLKGASK
ncbi:MAG TPA: peptide-methionine (S)-S-oxide reductase MsrA [Chloroflexota bacterium]|nr:peptide-methionine (S)-S-oxide reductase MsrA [Chloroflexota bacterium]